jgi:FtsP/CotA-like multicopper oxidase with cupredoxin domain
MPAGSGLRRNALLIVATVVIAVVLYGRFRDRGPDPVTDPIIAFNDMGESAGVMRDGVLTLQLEVRAGEWFPDGPDDMMRPVLAFAEQSGRMQNPGPLIRVRAGTRVAVTVRNPLDRPLTMYGLGEQRGVMEDSVIIDSGSSHDFEFRADEPGVYYYMGKTTPVPTLVRSGEDSQLNGAIVVDRADGPPPDDQIFVISGWFDADSTTVSGLIAGSALVINGRGWPHTPRIEATQGDSVRFHWINATIIPHPMHLHGFYFSVDGNGDGATFTRHAPDQRQLAVTELMMPGQTMSMAWLPERPGNWILHCHFVGHMSTWEQLNKDRHYPAHVARGGATNTAANGAAAHGAHQMGGLVLGIKVKQKGRAAAITGNESELRLIIRSKPNVYGEYTGYSYILDGSPAEHDHDAMPVPGPLLLLEKGQRVAVNIVNQSHEPAAIHWHGIELESFPDGVPGWSGHRNAILPAIPPGDSLVVRYHTPRAGTFMYHSHFNEFQQIASGMYAPLIVLEPGQQFDPELDRVLLFSDAGPTVNVITGPFPPALLNGRERPDPMEMRAGTRYRLRLINIRTDYEVTVALLDGDEPVAWQMIARDGADLPATQRSMQPADLMFGAGQIFDFEYTPTRSGELTLRFGFAPEVPIAPVSVPVRVRAASVVAQR